MFGVKLYHFRMKDFTTECVHVHVCMYTVYTEHGVDIVSRRVCVGLLYTGHWGDNTGSEHQVKLQYSVNKV